MQRQKQPALKKHGPHQSGKATPVASFLPERCVFDLGDHNPRRLINAASQNFLACKAKHPMYACCCNSTLPRLYIIKKSKPVGAECTRRRRRSSGGCRGSNVTKVL